MRTEESLELGMFGSGSRIGERIARLLERGAAPGASRGRVAIGAAMLLGSMVAGAVAPRWIALAHPLLRMIAEAYQRSTTWKGRMRIHRPQMNANKRKFLAILLGCTIALAQEGPRFDVASVKPNGSGGEQAGWRTDAGGLSASHLSLKALILRAYAVKDYQLAGGPGWIDSNRYDAEGKTNHAVSEEQVLAMLQGLLADRFKLALHREMKELPVYALGTGKSGSKLREVSVAGTPESPVMFRMAGPEMQLSGKQAPMRMLTPWLNSVLTQSGRPVLDETGLTGVYELELEAGRREMEMLVIDHVEKPDAN